MGSNRQPATSGEFNEGPAPLGTEEAPIDCQRVSPRLNQRDRIAAVFRNGERFDLRVLNLSRSGIMAECQVPLAVGEHVAIALDRAGPVSATALWVQGLRFGAQFASALPFEALWPPARPYGMPQPVRAGADRIVVDAFAIVHRLDAAVIQGRIRNVSARGMLVETAAVLMPGQLIEVEVDGWARRATVMWSRDGKAGLQLERPLTEVQMLGLKLASAVRGEAS